MGNKYGHVATIDPDQLIAQRMPHSCSAACFICRRQVMPAVHSDSVGALAVVRPGMVISGSRDLTLALHNVDSHECLHRWKGHDGEVTAVAYSNINGQHAVLSGSRDKTIKFWQFMTVAPDVIYDAHNLVVTGLTVCEDGKFASGSRDTVTKLWDINRNVPLRSSGKPRNMITHMVYSSATRLIAQTAEDKQLKLWDPRGLDLIQRFGLKNNILMQCDWIDEFRIVTASNGFNGDGGEITVWDRRSGKILRELRGHDGSVCSVSTIHNYTFPNKTLLASCSDDRTCKIWNVEDGACLWTEELMGQNCDLLQCMSVADTHVIVSGGRGFFATMRLNQRLGKPFLQINTIQRSQD